MVHFILVDRSMSTGGHASKKWDGLVVIVDIYDLVVRSISMVMIIVLGMMVPQQILLC